MSLWYLFLLLYAPPYRDQNLNLPHVVVILTKLNYSLDLGCLREGAATNVSSNNQDIF